MIGYSEVVLDWYTDEHLIVYASRGEGQRAYAGALLNVPPHYREGIQARVSELTRVYDDDTDGISWVQWTGVRSEVARRQAMGELVAQGVELLDAAAEAEGA